MDVCWSFPTQSACLPIFCHSILQVCWWCASISAIPIGMVPHKSTVPAGKVPHYRPCLLVWSSLSILSVGVMPHYRPCLWGGTSLSAMPSGVVPHYSVVPQYQQYLLVWFLAIGHACWSIDTATDILLVKCR